MSFSIPFGLDSDVDIVMGNPVITRSVSSDQLNPAGQNISQAPYTPPEDLSHLLSKPPGPNGPQRASWATQSPSIPRMAEENGLAVSETGELPTIEEALQIIHNESKMEPRLHPDGAPDGFYLHSPDDPSSSRNNLPISCSAPSRSGMMYRPMGESRESTRTRNTSECSRDDDSVLRDGSVDSDASEDLPKAQSTPNTPAAGTHSARGLAKEVSDSGVRMTSFAECKKKQIVDSPKANTSAPTQMTSWAQKSEESPSKSPQLNNDGSELEVRLQEKRRAIEAQKKRIEAIFAKHRQRLGKSAFMQLKKEQREDEAGEEKGDGQVSTSSTEEELSRLTLEDRLARMEEEEQQDQAKQEQHLPVDNEGKIKGGPQLNKPLSHSKEMVSGPGQKSSVVPGEKMAAPLGDYNNAVSKLTAALSSLQSDMQRLTEQQDQLLKKKTPAPSNKSWVIPASPKTSTSVSTPVRMSREPNRDPNSASPSPSRKFTNHTTPKSPQVHRRAQSVPPKSPKHQHSRPIDSKPPFFSRVIAPPQNVDRIPHLRRVNPWQSQVHTSSSFSIGDSESFGELHSSGPTPVPTPTHTPVPASTPTPHPVADDAMSVGSHDDHSIFSMDLEAGPSHDPAANREGVVSRGCSSGAPSECSFESDAPASMVNGKRSSLIEISLSALRAEGEEDDQVPDPFPDSVSERTEPEMKGGVGFFFKVGHWSLPPVKSLLILFFARSVHSCGLTCFFRMTKSYQRMKWPSEEQLFWRNSRREQRR